MSTSTSGGTTTSFNNTPQAKDDFYIVCEDRIVIFDVMANDLGGNAKVLWSIDNTTTDGSADLIAKDVAGVCEYSELGAKITLTADGKISYDTNALDSLAAGETATDRFTYAIRLSNGTLSWATVTVTVTGANDGPDIKLLTGDSASAGIAETNAGLSANGTLTVFDADTTDTVNISVSSVSVGGTGGSGGLTNAQLLTMLSLTGNTANASNGAQGSLGWAFSSGTQSFDYLAAGETLVLSYTLTGTDGNGGTDTQSVTITITGTNDAATITGNAAGDVLEDGDVLTTGGTLVVSDVDSGEAALVAQANAAGDNGYGTFQVAADGTWSYTLNNALAAVQELPAGAELTDTITVWSEDGTASQQIVVTITGTNDAATITGNAAGDVLEDGDVLTTGGTLVVSDVDSGEAALVAQANAAGDNGYGTFQVAADGTWSYTLNNALAAVQELPAGAELTDTITVWSEDGTASQQIVVTITGTNDAATITGNAAGDVLEDGDVLTTGGTLVVSDVDSGEAALVAQANAAGDNGYGTFQVAADGTWSYTLNNALAAVQELPAGAELTDTITVWSEDGTASQQIVVTITGTNDAATITGNAAGDVLEDGDVLTTGGTLVVSDVDSGEAALVAQANAAGDNGYGTFQVAADGTWSYTLNNALAAVQELPAGAELTDTITVWSEDGTASQQIVVTITGTNDAATITGNAAGDVLEDGDVLTTGGTLVVSDVDSGEAALVAQANAAGDNGYGTFQVAADGTWSYTLNNALAAVQELPAGAELTDTITVWSEDGTASQQIVVTITGTNDAATITGNAAGDVLEDGDVLTTGGTLVVSDVDSGEAALVAQANAAGDNGYGTFQVAADGTWSYTLNNALAAVQELPAGAELTDTITVWSEDGTASQQIVVTITGTNDAPVLTGDLAASINEGGSYQLTTADLNFTDPDDVAADETFTATGLSYGTLFVNGIAQNSFTGAQLAAGLVTFTHDGSETPTAGFSVSVEDGNEDASTPTAKPFTFTVAAANDAPVNNLPVSFSTNEDAPLKLAGLSVTDVDAGAGSISVTLSVATGTLTAADAGGVTVSGSGTASVTLNGTLAAINTYLATVANQPTFTPMADTSGVVTLTMTTNDNGNSGAGGALSDTDMRAITVNAVNDNPVTTADIIWASNATVVTLPWDVLLGNDRDPDGLALALQSVVVTTGTLGGTGTVTVNPNGTFSFTTGGAGGTVGTPTTVTLTYTTTDGLGGSATGTITLNVVTTVDSGGGAANNVNLSGVGAYQASYIDGKGGTDTLTDGGGTSVLIGGAGNNDTLIGGAGRDILRGGAGNGDTMDGGAGSEDMLDFSDGTTAVTFTLDQTAGSHSIPNASGNLGNGDTYQNIEGVIGTSLGDSLTGDDAANDILRGGGGNDTLDGAGGTADLLDLSDATAGFTINFSQGVGQSITAAGIGTDTYSSFEGVIGSGFADTINGSTGNDFLRGGGGNDAINGGDGNDTITGGLGADTLTGDDGADDFVFDGLNGVDTITDFDGTEDRLLLEDFIFSAIGGALDAGEFVSNSGGVAGDANDFLLYDADTGSLYYDADGNGAGARILIATFTGAPTIGPTDILII